MHTKFLDLNLIVILVVLLLVLLFFKREIFGQTVIISPNGGITYVYPGNPAVAIGPNGGVTYIYPGLPPITPVPVLPPSVYTPLPSYSYGGIKP